MSTFSFIPRVDEAQMAREASEYFTRLYRLALDEIGQTSFSPDGDGMALVKNTFDMRLRSENTRRVIEAACDTIVRNVSAAELKKLQENEEFKDKTTKEITTIVREHQVQVLKDLVDASFEPGGVSHKAICDVFAMKTGSQQLMRIIEASVLSLIESKTSKNANDYIESRRSEIADQLAPRIEGVVVDALAKIDVARLVETKIQEVAERVVYEKAKQVADELIGDAIYEDVRKRLPHSAVPFVGRVCDSLPFEAILRHYLKKNALPLANTVIVDLARKMYERQLSKMMENAAGNPNPDMPMPHLKIVTEGNVTTITVAVPGEENAPGAISVPDIPSKE